MERHYTASAYTIDFVNHNVLLVYNTKLKKWLQPGGHIDGLELPSFTAIRETKEETGIDIELIGETFNSETVQPIAIEHYENNVGDMIDIQYIGIPKTTHICSEENKQVIWQDILRIDENKEIDEEIKIKVKTIYNKYK